MLYVLSSNNNNNNNICRVLLLIQAGADLSINFGGITFLFFNFVSQQLFAKSWISTASTAFDYLANERIDLIYVYFAACNRKVYINLYIYPFFVTVFRQDT